jgi:hypothetical protein
MYFSFKAAINIKYLNQMKRKEKEKKRWVKGGIVKFSSHANTGTWMQPHTETIYMERERERNVADIPLSH